MNKQELVEHWERTGLLEKLDDFNKSECAISLQECADLLTGKKNDYMKEVDKAIGADGFYAGCILPIVRRIYETETGAAKAPSLSMEWLMEDFGEYAKRNYQLIKDLNSTPAYDGEAEFVQAYMNMLERKL